MKNETHVQFKNENNILTFYLLKGPMNNTLETHALQFSPNFSNFIPNGTSWEPSFDFWTTSFLSFKNQSPKAASECYTTINKHKEVTFLNQTYLGLSRAVQNSNASNYDCPKD
jgi:hypothetical protein